MTRINRVYFEPSDVKAIQLECAKCGTTMSFVPRRWKLSESLDCPDCGTRFAKRGDSNWLALDGLAMAIRTLTFTPDDKSAFAIRFEFVHDSGGLPSSI